MKRAVLLIGAILLSTVVLAGLAAGFLLGTAPGAALLWTQARLWVPGLEAGRIAGSVAGGLQLTGLHYRHAGVEAKVGSLALAWRPGALLHGELRVTRLAVAEVALTLPETAAPAEEAPAGGPPALPEIALPLNVTLEEVRLDGLTFQRGETRQVLDTFELAATLRGRILTLSRLHLAAPQGDAALTASLVLGGEWPLLANLTWRATLPDQPLLEGSGKVEGPLLRPRFAQQITAPFRLSLEGAADVAGASPTAEVAARWQEARWPLAGDAAVASKAGELHFDGGPEHYRISLDAELHGAQVPAGQWRLEAQGDAGSLQVERLTGATLKGELSARGEVAWAPAVRWHLTLAGEGLDPGAQWPEWPGTLAFDAGSSGELRPQGVVADVALTRLDGRLRGYPVEGHGKAAMDGERLTVEQLRLGSGKAFLEAAGALAETWDLHWQLDAPSLSHLLPEAKGSFAAEGRLSGPRETPRLKATLRGRGVAYDTLRLRDLEGEVNLDLAPGQRSTVALTGSGLRAGDQAIDTLRLSGSGTPESHGLTADVVMPGRDVTLALVGGWAQPRWRGTLARLDLTDATLGRWGLAQPVALDLSAEAAQVAPFCWVSGAAKVCGEGRWQAPGWSGAVQLEALPLALAQPWLPETAIIAGTLGGAVKAAGEGVRWRGEGQLAVAGGAIELQQEAAEPLKLAAQALTVQSRFAQDGAQVQLSADLKEAGTLRAEVGLTPPAGDWAGAALSGSASLKVPSLSPFAPFISGVEKPTGALAAELALGGSVAVPSLTGEAALTGLTGRIPAAGIDLADGAVRVVGDADGKLRLEGGIASGGGRLALAGEAALDGARGWPVNLTVKGEGFEAANLPEARVLVSPDLAIAYAGGSLQVSGQVTVPEAKITVRELPESAVAVSSDVVVDEPGQPAPAPTPGGLKVSADVELRLGRKVSLEGFGLKTRLAGGIRVREEPDRLPRGEGELRLEEGTYRAYGQDLAIERGRLIFAGPVDNPAIDVRATRTVEEVVAGIQVTGTVRDSRVTLYSTPTMEQSEVLSYLLLGRPLSSASESDGRMMQKAVGALGVSGGNLLAKKIGSRLGFDEVKVESDGGLESASLVLGRYLSPKLYVSYGVGLFQPGNSVRMRYDLSKRIKLQAESGTQSGMDIYYTIER